MKVMGSATMVLQAIVIVLAIPVAIVTGDYNHTTVLVVGSLLVLLCILSVGGIRRDRVTAIRTGTLVQTAVLAAGIAVRPFLVPGILFALVWLLAVKLSEKTDLERP